MSVRIQLDRPHAFYTNMDFITGRVILSLTSEETISAVIVKLEGECKTQLPRSLNPQYPKSIYHQPSRRDARSGVAMENHKTLYRVSLVFPSNSGGIANLTSSYILRAGSHEYPFRIKIPFNNSCADPETQQLQMGFTGFGLSGLQQMQYRHVRKTLPPSLTGYPGILEIRYYIKATVQRPSLFKENRRSAISFKFMPIEPPRPPATPNEIFAKRPYVFIAGLAAYAKKGMFNKKPVPLSDTAPTGEVDCRLPSPAILTCNSPIPLRIILKKINDSPETVFLMSLQVQLVGITEVRALGEVMTRKNNWPLITLNGLSMPVVTPDDAVGSETLLDKTLWDQIPLPNTIAPSFNTCNVTRKYTLEVRVGLGYGHLQEVQPQTLILPLEFNKVEVYSGITPPTALLDAMASRPHPQSQPSTVPSSPGSSMWSTAPSATTNTSSPAYDPAYPPQVGTVGAPPIDDAPPSYEDAIAEDITPVTNGPRPEYSGVTDENAPALDEKGSAVKQGADGKGGNRRPSGGGAGGGAGNGNGNGSAGVGGRSAVV